MRLQVLATWVLVAHKWSETEAGHGGETDLQELTNGAESFHGIPCLSLRIASQ